MLVSERVASFARMGPARSFEDVPISLALYPVVVIKDGLSVINDPGKARDGKRWGMSSTWEPGTEHYRLPESVLVERPPHPSQYVTAAPVFDYVFETPARTRDMLAKNVRVKDAAKDGACCEEGMIAAKTMIDIAASAVCCHDLPHDRFMTMLADLMRWAEASRLEQVGVVSVKERSGRTVGFQMLWREAGMIFLVHRYLIPDRRSWTRFLDMALMDMASSLGAAVNMGDSFGMPGVMSYKMSLKPSRLATYLNVLNGHGVGE